MNSIYLFDGKAKLGPFSIDEIKLMTIAPGTKFWYEGLPQWLPIEKLPDANIGGQSITIHKKPLKKKQAQFLWILSGLVFLAIFALYGLFFNDLSESKLVEISFYWFGPLVFCITSLIATYNRSEKAILWGLIVSLIGTFALVLFFAGLWSAL